MGKVARTNDNEIETEKRIFELLARSNANQGKLERAEKWCLKAVATAKLNLQCRYLLAVIQLDMGKIDEAVLTLKQCLYIDPNFIPAHFTMAHIAQQKKNYTEANRYFDNCLSLLNGIAPDTEVMEMDGVITAGRMKEMIINLKKVPNE
jgi:chemotaxis protein methyltransferase CheR